MSKNVDVIGTVKSQKITIHGADDEVTNIYSPEYFDILKTHQIIPKKAAQISLRVEAEFKDILQMISKETNLSITDIIVTAVNETVIKQYNFKHNKE